MTKFADELKQTRKWERLRQVSTNGVMMHGSLLSELKIGADVINKYLGNLCWNKALWLGEKKSHDLEQSIRELYFSKALICLSRICAWHWSVRSKLFNILENKDPQTDTHKWFHSHPCSGTSEVFLFKRLQLYSQRSLTHSLSVQVNNHYIRTVN